MNQPATDNRSTVFYGWYMLAACFFLLFFQAGIRLSFGVTLKPMIQQLGWNRASISGAFLSNMVFLAGAMTLGGRLYDKYGPKWVIVGATLLLSAGYIGTAFVKNLWQFHLTYGVLTALGTGGASVPLVSAIISNWFEDKRGLAISLALAGTCAGQFIMVPVVAAIVERADWRIAYLMGGLIILVVQTGLALFFIRGKPSDMGLKPYRAARHGAQPAAEARAAGFDPRGMSLRQAMGTLSFWLIVTFMFVCGSGDFLIITHFIAFVTDFGTSAVTAANMMAWFGLLSAVGILVAGPLADRIGNKLPITLMFGLRIALFGLILSNQSIWACYLFAAMFGFTFLITAPLVTTLLGKLYGFTNVGVLVGFVTTLHHVGGGLWSYCGGVLFESTGSYRMAFILSAVLSAVALLAISAVQERRHMQQTG